MSLGEFIEQAGLSSISQTRTGKILTMTAANGHTTQWTIAGDISPLDLADVISELADRHEEAVAYLDANSLDETNEELIFTEIMDKLRPVKTVYNDYSKLRCGPTEEDL